ncbi:MAG: DNA replication and repair protein RecF [Muribaculaceae bacterium]|nr:DNA replication and repair protein RecF [Muribaculaceae bacterium]
MRLRSIDIVDFKNIQEASLEFSEGVNCLLGMNGMGKSNLLEAIHFLCLARPMQSLPESGLTRHGADMMMVKGAFSMDAGVEESVSCGIVKGKGKTLKCNGKEYQRISEHIGRFPIVSVTPADHALVSGSAEERRKLMDMVISQGDRTYLSHLIRYTRSLESRNRMLRAGVRDALLYDSVEATMSESAQKIHDIRARWVEELIPDFRIRYSEISGDAEKASIRYSSVLNEETLPEVLERTRAKDQALGYTSRGVHRDDLLTGLGEYSMRRLGSQGQVKTFTIALRLAVFSYLRRVSGQTPILLLDDIFDKLDAGRVARIMRMVSGDAEFGQIFITDTNREHLDEILDSISGESSLFMVEDGKFTPLAAKSPRG